MWAIIFWCIALSPKWHYVIRTDFDNLYIGDKVYPWADVTELKIERNNAHRILRLNRRSGKTSHQVSIKDDILGFDELAQECFWQVNTLREQAEPSQNQTSHYLNQDGINP
jgi:hypothetical protein